jgi:hypothetical protein
VGLEGHPPGVDLGQPGQGEDLKPTAVGQDGPVPVHEAVQPREAADHLAARPQVQVVGVAQDDLRPGGDELLGCQRLHRAQGPDRHEHRGFDRAVRGLENPRPGAAASRWVGNIKTKHGARHWGTLS